MADDVLAKLIGGLFQTPDAFLPGVKDIHLDGQWMLASDGGDRMVSSKKTCTGRSNTACKRTGLANEHRQCFLDEEEIVA